MQIPYPVAGRLIWKLYNRLVTAVVNLCHLSGIVATITKPGFRIDADPPFAQGPDTHRAKGLTHIDNWEKIVISIKNSMRVIGLGAAIAMSAGLVACSGGDSGGNAGSGDSADEQVTLSVYSWRQEDTEGYKRIFDAFTEEHPNITVKFEPFNSTDYDQILSTALQSGGDLDLIQLRAYARGQEIIKQDLLAPVTDLKGMDNFTKAQLDSVTGEDGEVYGVPLAFNAAVTLYNKDLFEEKGIAVPATWKEFLAACDKLKAAGVTPIAQSGSAAYILSLMHAAVGSAEFSDEFVQAALDGTADLSGPEFKASVERALALEPYFPENFVGISDEEARVMFATGKAAMYINGDYRIDPLLELNSELNMGFLPSLTDSDGPSRLVTFLDSSFAASSGSKHLNEAKELLAYMATPEFGTAFSKEFGRMSPVAGVTASDELHQQMIDSAKENGTTYLIQELGGGQPDVKVEFENGLQGVFTGQITLDKLLTLTQNAYSAAHGS